MRIASTFHDYYDCVQSQGQDQTLIYQRKPQEFEVEEYPFTIFDARYAWSILSMVGYVIGFCGKLYPCIKIPTRYAGDGIIEGRNCYSPEEVQQYIEMNMHKRDVKLYAKPPHKRGRWRDRAASNARIEIEKFFADVHAEADKHAAFFDKIDAPIFCARGDRVRVLGPHRHMTYILHVHACLGDMGFVRVLDPYTAFQELSMYLGGKAQAEKPIPAIPDKIMVGAKGFDRFSFRKDPGKKKRGKKK